jgi:hypothetical protein
VLFLGYDVAAKDGKGIGCGSRTLYRSELPAWMAKSRTGADPIPLTNADVVWKEILK